MMGIARAVASVAELSEFDWQLRTPNARVGEQVIANTEEARGGDHCRP